LCKKADLGDLRHLGRRFRPLAEYRVEPRGRLHAFCAAVPGEWHLMGVMLSAAGSFQWYRDALAQDVVARARELGRHPYALLDEEASTVPAGADGLLFLPYLSGERTPHPDPYARGAFIGLTLRHRKAHMCAPSWRRHLRMRDRSN
jgi:xylulokinase